MKSELEDFKKAGNDCMKDGKHIEAMLHYTEAIKRDPQNHLLFSNRSLAFLKLQQYYFSLEDARTCTRLQPEWPKGYYRKGEAEFAAQHYKEALASFKLGLSIEPNDTGLQEAVTKATQKFREVRQQERRIPFLGVGGGLFFGLLLVIGDSFLAAKPTLQYTALQVIVVVACVLIGYGLSTAYKYLLKMQRDALLEEPLNLYPDEKSEKSDASTATGSVPRSHPKGRPSTGRQRFKKGKD